MSFSYAGIANKNERNYTPKSFLAVKDHAKQGVKTQCQYH